MHSLLYVNNLNQKELRNMDTTSKVITGFIVGVAAGAAAGLLLAPQSGDRTRRNLSKESERMIDSLAANVKDTVDETISAIRNTYNTKVDELSRNAKETAREARSSMKAN